ncbi:MAG: DUF4403 family protein [Aminivibrio sp.]|jgi:hypothetical protein
MMKKAAAAIAVFLALALGSAYYLLTSPPGTDSPAVLAARPPYAVVEETDPPAPAESFLSIPLSISGEEAGRLLDDALTNPLYNVKGQKLDDSYGESSANILVEKTGPAAASFKDGRVEIQLPFRFESLVRWKGKILGLSSSTTQEIAGRGRLRLTVTPRIDRDWKILLEGGIAVDWQESPAVTVLGQKIGIGRFLASILEERSGDLLKRAEEEINRSAALKERAREQWERLGAPILLTDSPRIVLKVRPLALSIPPFVAEGGVLTAHVALRCLLEATSEAAENSPPSPLPLPAPMPPGVDPGVLINVGAFVSYRALEQFLAAKPADPIEIPGGGMVKVEKISLFGSGKKLVAAADISGNGPMKTSLDGKVYLAGEPEYSREEQALRVKNVDFDEDSTRGLMKAASWIARPLVAGAVEESLVFPLGDIKEKAIKSLGEALNRSRLSGDVLMEGAVHYLELENLALTSRGLRLSFSLGGAVSLEYRENK